MITSSGCLFLLASFAITFACADVIPGRKLTKEPRAEPDIMDFTVSLFSPFPALLAFAPVSLACKAAEIE